MKMKKNLNENRKNITSELLNPENWKPNLSKISRKLNVPVSTIFDVYKRIK